VFEVHTDPPADGLVVVRAAGEVDMTVSPVFEQTLVDAATTHAGGRVVVDLEQLRFLDSSGVHALVKGYHAAAGAGGSLTVRNATGVVARVLHITGVADALGMAAMDEPGKPDEADEYPRGA
jgi:anti-anti-sigma factor